MTVNRTTLLDLPLPVTGTESGTWGDTTNNGLSQYTDIAIAGMTSLTSANFTAGALTIANTLGDSSATNIAAGSAQFSTIKVSSLAQNSTITAPGNSGTPPVYSGRSYRIINADATYSLTIKASGQTGVTLLPGQSAVVAFNGTDYVIVGTVGAGTATDNAVARFDGTTGEILQNSAATIDDTGAATFVGSVNVSGTSASAADLKLYEDTDNGTNYVAFKAPAAVTSNLTLTLPAADGSANQAIVTDGSGTLSFATISTSAATPTARGTLYGSDTSGSPYTTAVGYNAGAVATGVNNSFFGFEAGKVTTTGANNVAVGYGALDANTTGQNNVAVGYDALGGTTVSNNSVAVGYQALTGSNTNGSNIAVGSSALKATTSGTQNVALGGAALEVNTTGSYNSALGLFALYNNTTAQYNTAIGYQAGYTSNATSAPSNISANVFIGANTGYSATSAINSTIVGGGAGYSINSGSSNTIVGRLAGFYLTSGTFNTFVGPGDGNGGSGHLISTGGKNTIIGAYSGNQDGLDIRTASNYAVISDGDGNRLLSTANGYSLALDGGAVPQSGTGITFPATQSASSDANTLDDYEEGTWTPNVGGTATYNNQDGSYIKIGQLVYVHCFLSINTIGTGSTTVVSGLPFNVRASAADRNQAGSINFFSSLATSVVSLFCQPISSSTTVNFPGLTAGATAVTNPITVFQSSTQIYFSAVYQTNT